MEDLPLGRIEALVPEFAVKHLPLGRTLMIFYITNYYSFIFLLFYPAQRTTYAHSTYNSNVMDQQSVGGARLWTRTLDKSTRADLHPESMLSRMSEPPPETTEDSPRMEYKIPDPTRYRAWATGLESRNSIDHATATAPIINNAVKKYTAITL